MPSIVHVESPGWVPTGDSALPWRVETSQYTGLMAGWLDAGVGNGVLWCVNAQGHNLCYAPESVGYIDIYGRFDPICALAHVEARVDGGTITFDAQGYRVRYQALVDRLKLSILLLAPFRAPDPTLVDPATAMLTLTGGIVIPVELEVRDSTGAVRTGNWATPGEIRLWGAGEDRMIQYLDRVTARDSAGHPGHGEMRLTTDLDGTRRLYQGLPWGWLQVASWAPTEENPDGGVEIDPTVVTTSTSAASTAYSNQRKVLRVLTAVNGNYHVVDWFYDGTAICYAVSQDGGQTFGSKQTVLTPSTRKDFSLVQGPDDWFYLLYHGPSNSPTVAALQPAADRLTWSVASSVTVDSGNTSFSRYCAALVSDGGTGWKLGAAWSNSSGTVSFRAVSITSAHAMTADGSVITVRTFSMSTHNYPVLAVDSNRTLTIGYALGSSGGGASKQAAYPWSAFGAEEVFTSHGLAVGVISAISDSQGRPVVAYRSEADDQTWLFRRGSVWTNLSGVATEAGATSVSIAPISDDIYVFYTLSGLKYRKYVASTGQMSAVVTLDSTATAANVTARPDSTGQALDVEYTVGSVSPYEVKHARVALNNAPLEPTLTASPAAFDAANGADITIARNDADAGDTLASFALKRVVAGVTDYWNNTTKLFQAGEIYNSVAGGLISYTISAVDLAGKFTNGTTPQLFSSTRDAAGATGPYNTTPLQLTAAPAPVCTVSSPADEGTVSGDSVTLQWAIATGTQAAYRVRLVAADADPATAPALGASDTGEVSGTALARTLTYSGANGERARGAVRIKSNDGVWGPWAPVDFTFSYVPPLAAQNLSAAADISRAAVRLSWDRGVVGGNQNTSFGERWRVRRRKVGSAAWIDMAEVPNPDSGPATYADYTPAAGQIYEYQVVALSNNGTESPAVTAEGTVRFAVPWLIHPTDSGQNTALRVTDRTVQINHPQSATETETLGATRKSISLGEVLGAEFDLTIVADHRNPRTYNLAEILRQLKGHATTWLLKLPQAPGALMTTIPGRVFEMSLGAMREVTSPTRTVVVVPVVEVGDPRE